MCKKIVITGATSGIGKELAIRFVEKGWEVIGLGRKYSILKEMEKAYPALFKGYQVDIRFKREVIAVFKIIGEFDVLVNNAGVYLNKPFTSCTLEDIDRIIDTNLKGTMYCTHEALKHIKEGRIINISSVAGLRGIKNEAIYSASKYGMNGFANALNQEIIEKNVSITTLSLGGVNTPLWNKENQYPSYFSYDMKKLLSEKDVVEMIENIIELKGKIILKDLIMFPSNEWH